MKPRTLEQGPRQRTRSFSVCFPIAIGLLGFACGGEDDNATGENGGVGANVSADQGGNGSATGGSGNGNGNGNASGGGGSTLGPGENRDGPWTPRPDAECPEGQAVPSSFADALQTIPVPTAKYNGGGALIAEAPDGVLLVAWAANPKAEVHITKLHDGSSEDILIEGYKQAYSIRVVDGFIHLLARSSEEARMDYLRLSMEGTIVKTHTLVEGRTSDAKGTTWGDDILLDDGYNRMVVTPDGFSAYFPISRLFGGNATHQGDTLRHLSSDGAPDRTGWDWGCSHSDSQRIAYNGSALGTLCVTDSKPYGIQFNKSKTVFAYDAKGPGIYSGILALGLSTLLPVENGFVALYSRLASNDWKEGWQDPTHLRFVSLDNEGSVVGDTLVTNKGRPWQYSPSPQLAPYPKGYLAGWSEGVAGGHPISKVVRLDATGKPTGDAETIDVPLGRGEFTVLSNGDVAWATKVNNRDLTVALLPACQP